MKRLPLLGPPGFQPNDGFQSFPMFLVGFQSAAKIGGHHHSPPVVPPVALLLILEDVGHEIRLPKIGVGCFVGIEKINHRFVQMALVALQRNQVISFLINDLRRHLLLTAHRVQGHHAALDLEHPQELGQHRDLVALVRGVDRSKDGAALVAERVDDVERLHNRHHVHNAYFIHVSAAGWTLRIEAYDVRLFPENFPFP